MADVLASPQARATTLRPLCVDLDGTLVKSDTLVDSLLVLVRTRPGAVFGLARQLFRGKAAFKEFVTQRIALDVAHLPYNRRLLQALEEERRQGRSIYLATGANRILAERVAAHLGIFTGVLGSDASTNLTGNRKLEALRSHLASSPFDYVGNDTPDLPLLAQAGGGMVANPSWRLRRKLRAHNIQPAQVFEERTHPLRAALRAIRPRQWAKNLLVFLPLLLSHALSWLTLSRALVAFCCFSLTASAAYILNDLLDIEADRRHPHKRLRPFAAGDLSALSGLVVAAAFLALAVTGAGLLPLGFAGWLSLYLVSTLAYSWYLKRIALVDVLVLSGLYMLRLLAGGAATSTHISQWLLIGTAIAVIVWLAI